MWVWEYGTLYDFAGSDIDEKKLLCEAEDGFSLKKFIGHLYSTRLFFLINPDYGLVAPLYATFFSLKS